RRHTRWPRDWSSDVCSSDLNVIQSKVSAPPSALRFSRLVAMNPATNKVVWTHDDVATGGIAAGKSASCSSQVTTTAGGLVLIGRSEERRVGKGCRCGWAREL